jgi:hypothetical protein
MQDAVERRLADRMPDRRLDYVGLEVEFAQERSSLVPFSWKRSPPRRDAAVTRWFS